MGLVRVVIAHLRRSSMDVEDVGARGAEGVDGGPVPPSRPGCTTVARRKHAQVEGLERHAQTRFQGNDDLRKGQLTL